MNFNTDCMVAIQSHSFTWWVFQKNDKKVLLLCVVRNYKTVKHVVNND